MLEESQVRSGNVSHTRNLCSETSLSYLNLVLCHFGHQNCALNSVVRMKQGILLKSEIKRKRRMENVVSKVECDLAYPSHSRCSCQCMGYGGGQL